VSFCSRVDSFFGDYNKTDPGTTKMGWFWGYMSEFVAVDPSGAGLAFIQVSIAHIQYLHSI